MAGLADLRLPAMAGMLVAVGLAVAGGLLQQPLVLTVGVVLCGLVLIAAGIALGPLHHAELLTGSRPPVTLAARGWRLAWGLAVFLMLAGVVLMLTPLWF